MLSPLGSIAQQGGLQEGDGYMGRKEWRWRWRPNMPLLDAPIFYGSKNIVSTCSLDSVPYIAPIRTY